MYYALLLARVLALTISEIGWCRGITRAARIDAVSAPLVSVALKVCVLFVAGILNLLLPTAIVLVVVGVALLFVGLRTTTATGSHLRGQNMASEGERALWWCFALLAVMLGVAAWWFKGRIFTHYDNFSHWATIVEEMGRTQHYPRFDSEMILFQSYVPGAATWIWYVQTIVGITTDSLRMLAQCYVMLAAVLSLWRMAEVRGSLPLTIAGALCALAASVTLIIFNTPVYDLLVDTLLPVVAGGATLFAVTQVDMEDTPPAQLACLATLATFLALIKTSGLIFIAFMLVALRLRKASWKTIGVICLAVAAALVLWRSHCAYVFADGGSIKHTVSAENYANVFSEKTPADVLGIARALALFSVTGIDLALVAVYVVAAIPLTALFHRQQMRVCRTLILALGIAYVAYIVGMLGMYLFSMPLEEASRLAEADRYRRSMLILIAFAMTAYYLWLATPGDTEPNARTALPGIVVIALWALLSLAPIAGEPVAHGLKPDPEDVLRRALRSALIEGEVPQGSSYFICVPAERPPHDYAWYLAYYDTWSHNVNVVEVHRKDDLGVAEDYAWLINLDPENSQIAQWIEERYPQQSGQAAVLLETEDAEAPDAT